ncbi:MAG: GNAT family N-acetyltransferase [Desulfococcaceae bacterium]
MSEGLPTQPGIGVGGVVFQEGRVLLVLRSKEPAKDQWAVPGGRLELGETLEAAVERELLEETGVRVRAGEVDFTFEHIERDDAGRVVHHYVILDLAAEYLSGTPAPGDDARDARWVGEDELVRLPVNPATRRLLRTRHGFGEVRPAIRPLETVESEAVSGLVGRAFDRDVAPLYDAKGIYNFRIFSSTGAMALRAANRHWALVAELDGEPAGVLEVREDRHISMFFVDPSRQGMGVGRRLFEAAVARCRKRNPGLTRLTVCSSPNAVPVYARLGFRKEGPPAVESGIRFVPMGCRLPRS